MNFDDMSLNQLLELLERNMSEYLKSDEDRAAERNADLDLMRSKVIKSYHVSDNVNLHIIKQIPHLDVTNLINWLRRLNEAAPAKGNVDVYVPWTPAEYKKDGSEDNFDGGTTRVDAFGRMTLEGNNENSPHRIMFLSDSMMRDRASVLASSVNPNDPDWSMPVANHVSNLYYTLVHEWGHVIDNRPRSDDNPNEMVVSQKLIDGNVPQWLFASSLSSYAATAEVETYAETFAEWFISRGRTTNYAAKWYASEYNWHKFDNHKH